MTMTCGRTTCGRTRLVASVATYALLGISITPASAQQTTVDVLSFLLTNRTIITGDFDRDAQASATTRDTIATFLTQELATLPVSSSSSGFTYRLDNSLGTVIRSSDNFGPFYTERSLTDGQNRASFGIGYQSTMYQSIDGRNLRDGTLVSTAAILRAAARKSQRSFLGMWILCFWAGQTVQMASGDLLTYWRVLPVYFWILALALRP